MRLMLLLLLALLTTACAVNPVTGRRQLMLVSEEQAIRDSKEAYVAEMSQLDQNGKLSQDKALVRRVETITGKLVAQAIKFRPETTDWEWSVKVIADDETVNAFCMAGGRMAIYTGLIKKLDASDDEIAQVMGHEIAHALSNHTAEKMSVAMATSTGIALLGVAQRDNPLAVSAGAMAAAVAVQLPNSRTAETESDEIGIKLAAMAGYDPRAAVTLWQKMAQVSGAGEFDWLSTHPAPGKRQETLQKLVPKMDPLYRDPAPRPQYKLRH